MPMSVGRGVATLIAALCLGAGSPLPATAVASLPRDIPVTEGADGTFVPIDPVRVLDTRDGTGVRPGAVGPGGILTFDPSAEGQIPAMDVTAVLLNVTGTEPTAATHIRVWPAGEPLPGTSSLNLLPGQSRPNQVVVPLGQDGRVALYNNAGSTHLIVDVQGFYSDIDGIYGGSFHPQVPWRYLDTRYDTCCFSKLAPGEELWVPMNVTYRYDEVTALDVNITVTEPTAAGHITAWAGDREAPGVSNVNFLPGQTIANHSVVPVSTRGTWGLPGFTIRNDSAGWTHVLIDNQGWYDDGNATDGLRFAAVDTARVLDTRIDGERERLPDGETFEILTGEIPDALVHVFNLTATASTGPGHLTAWTAGQSLPPTSSVNYSRGEDAPNFATILAGPEGGLALMATTSSTHVVVDYLGFFY